MFNPFQNEKKNLDFLYVVSFFDRVCFLFAAHTENTWTSQCCLLFLKSLDYAKSTFLLECSLLELKYMFSLFSSVPLGDVMRWCPMETKKEKC